MAAHVICATGDIARAHGGAACDGRGGTWPQKSIVLLDSTNGDETYYIGRLGKAGTYGLTES